MRTKTHQSRTLHYPLDLPHLPFPRYDHRRLTIRDVLVHRLMSEFMNPSTVHPGIFDAYLEPIENCPGWSQVPKTWRSPFLHFSGSRKGSRRLLADLEVLEGLLCMDSGFYFDAKVNPIMTKVPSRGAWDAAKIDPGNMRIPTSIVPFTVGEWLTDLVMRHYLEIDDIALRLWLSRATIPRRPPGPLPSAAKRRDQWVGFAQQIEHARRRGHLHWLVHRHQPIIKRLQQRMAPNNQRFLYDGGACVASLRRWADWCDQDPHGARNKPLYTYWMFEADENVVARVPTWPRAIQPASVTDAESPFRVSVPPTGAKRSLAVYVLHRKSRDKHDFRGLLPIRKAAGGQDSPGDVRDRGRQRARTASEPPPGAYAVLRGPRDNWGPQLLYHPRMTLSQLDRRSRRRSLSRTRIKEMFDWTRGVNRRSAATKPQPKCNNCSSPHHGTSKCTAPCGHCGAPSPNVPPEPTPYGERWRIEPRPHNRPPTPYVHQNPHQAPQCPVAPNNRCKCVSFPTFHTARNCPIPCRRPCGNPARPGTLQHRNAMTCRRRCCMCGIRDSHSGRECRLGRCRCGAPHLGQDCSWNPACRVPCCDRYLCGMHCRECGTDRRPFVDRLCRDCCPEFESKMPEDWEDGVRRRKRGRGEGGKSRRGTTRRRKRRDDVEEEEETEFVDLLLEEYVEHLFLSAETPEYRGLGPLN